MLANRVAENFKPPKMPRGPHGMRRVLTFDETLAQMRADEARALKVKKTLDRPPKECAKAVTSPTDFLGLTKNV